MSKTNVHILGKEFNTLSSPYDKNKAAGLCQRLAFPKRACPHEAWCKARSEREKRG